MTFDGNVSCQYVSMFGRVTPMAFASITLPFRRITRAAINHIVRRRQDPRGLVFVLVVSHFGTSAIQLRPTRNLHFAQRLVVRR